MGGESFAQYCTYVHTGMSDFGDFPHSWGSWRSKITSSLCLLLEIMKMLLKIDSVGLISVHQVNYKCIVCR